jgi:TM2 domain-containing membrane protein YozV
MASRFDLNTGESKNIIVALLLWFFFGYWLGAHNYYLQRYRFGIAQFLTFFIGLLLTITANGLGFLLLLALFVWWALDLSIIFKNTNTSTILSIGSNKKKHKLDEIEKLHNLFNAGVLSKEQYEEKKEQLLNEY